MDEKIYFRGKCRCTVPFINAVTLLGTQVNCDNELIQPSRLKGNDSRLCHIYLDMSGLARRGSNTSACAQLFCSLPSLQDAINAHVYVYVIGMTVPPICVVFFCGADPEWMAVAHQMTRTVELSAISFWLI